MRRYQATIFGVLLTSQSPPKRSLTCDRTANQISGGLYETSQSPPKRSLTCDSGQNSRSPYAGSQSPPKRSLTCDVVCGCGSLVFWVSISAEAEPNVRHFYRDCRERLGSMVSISAEAEPNVRRSLFRRSRLSHGSQSPPKRSLTCDFVGPVTGTKPSQSPPKRSLTCDCCWSPIGLAIRSQSPPKRSLTCDDGLPFGDDIIIVRSQSPPKRSLTCDDSRPSPRSWHRLNLRRSGA